MIDPDAETFIVQKQADGRLLIQRVEIQRLRIEHHVEARLGAGLSFDRPKIALAGVLTGGGLYTPEEAARGFSGGEPRSLEN